MGATSPPSATGPGPDGVGVERHPRRTGAVAAALAGLVALAAIVAVGPPGPRQVVDRVVSLEVGGFDDRSSNALPTDEPPAGDLSKVAPSPEASSDDTGPGRGGDVDTTDIEDVPSADAVLTPIEDDPEIPDSTVGNGAVENGAVGDSAVSEDAADDGVLTPIGEGPDGSTDPDEPDTGDDQATIEGDDPTSRGRTALALIPYPWQEKLPGWTISFHPEKSGLYGLTLVTDKHIEVYVRDGQSDRLLAHVIAHELGHAVDVTLNDGPDRRRWAEARDIGSAPWWPGNAATDFSTGAGDFAESFAAWQVGSESFRSELGGPPTAAQVDVLQQLSAN